MLSWYCVGRTQHLKRTGTWSYAHRRYMQNGGSIADQVRRKLDDGLLPRAKPAKLWGGHGRGEPCSACGQPVFPAQIQYEFDDENEQPFRFHVGCLGLWGAELYRRGWLNRE